MRRTFALLGSIVAVVVLGSGVMGVRSAASTRGVQQAEPHAHDTAHEGHAHDEHDGHDHEADGAVEDDHGQADAHAGHAHAEEEAEPGHGEHDDHAGHDHGADHTEEWVVELSEQVTEIANLIEERYLTDAENYLDLYINSQYVPLNKAGGNLLLRTLMALVSGLKENDSLNRLAIFIRRKP